MQGLTLFTLATTLHAVITNKLKPLEEKSRFAASRAIHTDQHLREVEPPRNRMECKEKYRKLKNYFIKEHYDSFYTKTGNDLDAQIAIKDCLIEKVKEDPDLATGFLLCALDDCDFCFIEKLVDKVSFSPDVLHETAHLMANSSGNKEEEDFKAADGIILEKLTRGDLQPSLMRSLLFNVPGRFTVLGIPISFRLSTKSFFQKRTALEDIIRRASIFMDSFWTVDFLVHELGHAVTAKFLGADKVRVIIPLGDPSKNPHATAPELDDPKKTSIMCAMGPITEVAYRGVLAVLARIALSGARSTTGTAKAVCLGMAGRLIYQSSLGTMGAFLYAISSALKKDNGDFGKIAKNGSSHLVAALTALIGVSALSAPVLRNGWIEFHSFP